MTIRDQPNDVKHLNSDGYPITPERPHPKTDLLSVDVTNGCPDVRIVEHIADLQPGGYQEVDLGILTPQRKRSYHGWGVLPDTRVEQVAPFPMYWSASNRYSDLPWSCPDRSAQADFARDAVTFVVPISCLGQPTWVSIRAVNTDGDPNYDDYEDTLEPPAVGPDGWSPRAHR